MANHNFYLLILVKSIKDLKIYQFHRLTKHCQKTLRTSVDPCGISEQVKLIKNEIISFTAKPPIFEGLSFACRWLFIQHIHISKSTLRPRRLSSRGSGFLLTKNRADQPRSSNVVQLPGVLLRVENGNKCCPALEKKKQSCFETLNIFLRWTFFFSTPTS